MKIKLKSHYLYSVISFGKPELVKGSDLTLRKDIQSIYIFGAFHNTEKVKFHV